MPMEQKVCSVPFMCILNAILLSHSMPGIITKRTLIHSLYRLVQTGIMFLMVTFSKSFFMLPNTCTVAILLPYDMNM